MYDLNYNEDQLDRLLSAIHSGKINAANLPKGLYLSIGKRLEKGIYKGFKGNLTSFEFGSPDFKLLSELRENIYMFSAAKTHQFVKATEQLKKVSSFLIEGDRIATFKEFEEKAKTVFEKYHRSYLQTEYETAIGQAQSAKKWNDIESSKRVFPYLKYDAVEDKNTSDICRFLDGITLPVDHPFWNTHSPLNHFRCRCKFDKIDRFEEVSITKESKVKEVSDSLSEKIQPVFKSNPGKDKVIFNKEHPYFDVEPKYRKLAKRNFDLPIPAGKEVALK